MGAKVILQKSCDCLGSSAEKPQTQKYLRSSFDVDVVYKGLFVSETPDDLANLCGKNRKLREGLVAGFHWLGRVGNDKTEAVVRVRAGGRGGREMVEERGLSCQMRS